jgi:molybdopterin converting factor subunit 1
MMKIRVKLFAILREIAGQGQIDLELPHGAPASSAMDQIVTRFPSILPMSRTIAIAVNRSYARPDTILCDGDELALIPPVSGG